MLGLLNCRFGAERTGAWKFNNLDGSSVGRLPCSVLDESMDGGINPDWAVEN